MVCAGSVIHLMKAQPASFWAGGASRAMTKKVQPVGTACLTFPGRKAVPNLNLAFSVM
jgi:hypothetical protein